MKAVNLKLRIHNKKKTFQEPFSPETKELVLSKLSDMNFVQVNQIAAGVYIFRPPIFCSDFYSIWSWITHYNEQGCTWIWILNLQKLDILSQYKWFFIRLVKYEVWNLRFAKSTTLFFIVLNLSKHFYLTTVKIPV